MRDETSREQGAAGDQLGAQLGSAIRRSPRLVRGFVAFGVISLGLVLLGIYLDIDRAWDSLSVEQRKEAVTELVAHYDPIVEAVHAFETDRGCPPLRLEDLVPEYLPAVPEREPNHVRQFQLVMPSKAVPRDGGVWCLWYGLEESPCTCPPDLSRLLDETDWGESDHLMVVLDATGVVAGCLTDGYCHSEQYRGPGFDRWRSARGSRSSLVGSVAESEELVGIDRSRLLELLGPPDGESRLAFSWALTAYVQDPDPGASVELPIFFLPLIYWWASFAEYLEYEASLSRPPNVLADRGLWILHEEE